MTTHNPERSLTLDNLSRLNMGGDLAALGNSIRNLIKAVPYDAVVKMGEMVNSLESSSEQLEQTAKIIDQRIEQVRAISGYIAPRSFAEPLQAWREFSDKITEFVAAEPSQKASLDIAVYAAWDRFADSAGATWPV